MKETKVGAKIFRGTIIIVFVSALAKLASFISEAILAAYLGTGYQGDAYYMVSSVQQVIYPMLSVGIWNLFLPIYKSRMANNQMQQADSFANKTITFFSLISLVCVAVLIIFSGPVVSLVAPGFTGETKELCIKLVAISAPMYLFIIAAAVYATMLQCHDKFFGSQIREVASHIPVILAAILCYKKFGVYALAVALVAGGALRLLIELPFVDWGYRYKPDFKFKDPVFIDLLKKLPSVLLVRGITQINGLVDKMMASTLPTGAISALNYGHRLMHVFSGLLSSAVTTAMYPQIVELVSTGRRKELDKLLTRIFMIFAVLMVPLTIGAFFFRTEIVSVVFQRGAFNDESVRLTSGVFCFYMLGLFVIACSTVFSNLFYANGDTKKPMIVSIVNLVLNVGLNLILVRLMGVDGLALATSLSTIASFFLKIYLGRPYVSLEWKRILWTFGKIVLVSLVACVSADFLSRLVTAQNLFRLLIGVIIAAVIYIGGIYLLKVEELHDVIRLVKKKLKKK